MNDGQCVDTASSIEGYYYSIIDWYSTNTTFRVFSSLSSITLLLFYSHSWIYFSYWHGSISFGLQYYSLYQSLECYVCSLSYHGSSFIQMRSAVHNESTRSYIIVKHSLAKFFFSSNYIHFCVLFIENANMCRSHFFVVCVHWKRCHIIFLGLQGEQENIFSFKITMRGSRLFFFKWSLTTEISHLCELS